MRRRRKTEAAGTKESPEGLFIDFSSPSVPSYMHEPVAGGFSVSLGNAQSNKGIGNTATMHRPGASSSLIPPWVPTTTTKEQNYSTGNTATMHRLEASSSLIPPWVPTTTIREQKKYSIGNTATMHRLEASSSLIPPWPWVPTTTIREQNYSTNLMTTDPLQTPYGSNYTVSTDTSDTNLDVVDTISIQTFQALNLHNNLPFADIALNAGPASWNESEFNKPHPSDATKPKIGPQTTETVESTKDSSDEAKVKQIQDAKALEDTFIPSTIPEEIQAIIDSYLSGRPLLLVTSNKRFFDYWSLRLPKEFRFLMLGYFRILGVQVLTSSNPRFCVDTNILLQGISSSS